MSEWMGWLVIGAWGVAIFATAHAFEMRRRYWKARYRWLRAKGRSCCGGRKEHRKLRMQGEVES